MLVLFGCCSRNRAAALASVVPSPSEGAPSGQPQQEASQKCLTKCFKKRDKKADDERRIAISRIVGPPTRVIDYVNTEEGLAADEERVKAEAAEPLPEGSSWVEYHAGDPMGGPELEPLLAHTTLINVDWLVDFADGKVMPEREGVVPAWQQLPSEAIVSLTQLRQTKYGVGLPVAVLSYGWAAKHHPDPTGEQLRRMLPALRSMKNSKDWGVPTWGLVWDFMSLPQRGYTTKYDADHEDRTDYQLKRFIKGLKQINVWYGHACVTTLVCDWPMPAGAQNPHPIDVRGWCVFERHLSSIVKDGDCYLQLSLLPANAESLDWFSGVVQACKGARRPPLAADAFERLMRDNLESGAFKFTNGKDATNVCIPQYAEAFTRLLGTSKTLGYQVLGWGAAEGEQLAAALACAQRMDTAVAAEKLYLHGNELGTAGVRAIGKVIEAGALPRLKLLWIQHNDADDETREWIETVARGAGCSIVDA